MKHLWLALPFLMAGCSDAAQPTDESAAGDGPVAADLSPVLAELQGEWIVDVGDTDGAAVWSFEGDTIRIIYRWEGEPADESLYTNVEAEESCGVEEGVGVSNPGISFDNPDLGYRACHEFLERSDDAMLFSGSGSASIPLKRWDGG